MQIHVKEQIINGLDGNDIINGNAGNDFIYGGKGDDTLSTGDGNDHLFGDEGNDRLIINGTGSMTIDGGEGSDTLVIDANNFIAPNVENFQIYLSILNGETGGTLMVYIPMCIVIPLSLFAIRCAMPYKNNEIAETITSV